MKTATFNILGSSALSQLIIVASTPFLTRHYDQAEFGWFGVTTTISLLFSTCLTLRLEHSIHVTTLEPSKLFSACLHVILFMALLVALPMFFLMPKSVFQGADNAVLVFIFSVSHAICACATINLNFQQRFRRIAVLSLCVPIIFILGATIIRDIPLDANRLLFWQTIAYLATAVLSLVIQRTQLSMIGIQTLKRYVLHERQNVQFLVPSSFLSILSLNMSVIGATMLFDNAVAGFVVIAQRIARAPVSVIGNSMNEVLRASIPTREKIYPTFRTIFICCVCIALLMIAMVLFLPEEIYGLVLGDGWGGIKAILIITVIGASFQLVATSVFCMLTGFNKKSELLVNFALVAVGVSALAFAAWFELSALQYLSIQTLLTGLVYGVGFLLAHRVAIRETG